MARTRTDDMTPDERREDFERRLVTDYATLPPEYVAELQRRMSASDQDRRSS